MMNSKPCIAIAAVLHFISQPPTKTKMNRYKKLKQRIRFAHDEAKNSLEITLQALSGELGITSQVVFWGYSPLMPFVLIGIWLGAFISFPT